MMADFETGNFLIAAAAFGEGKEKGCGVRNPGISNFPKAV